MYVYIYICSTYSACVKRDDNQASMQISLLYGQAHAYMHYDSP